MISVPPELAERLALVVAQDVATMGRTSASHKAGRNLLKSIFRIQTGHFTDCGVSSFFTGGGLRHRTGRSGTKPETEE
jgi:hypothetical protein